MKARNLLCVIASVFGGMLVSFVLFAVFGSSRASAGVQAFQQQLLQPPVTFLQGPWPDYAHGAISVHPNPFQAGQPIEFCAALQNHNPIEILTPTLEFAVGILGIGVPHTPIGEAIPVPIPPGGEASRCIYWVPPSPGPYSFEAILHFEGWEDQYIWYNVDLNEPLQPGVPHSSLFVVSNPLDEPANIALQMTINLPGWGASLSQYHWYDVPPGESHVFTLTVTPSLDMPVGEAFILEVEGWIEASDSLFLGGFHKLYRPPVLLHRTPDPIYAESEISINPYPPQAGEPTEICVSLENPTSEDRSGLTHFSWAPFGIGLPFTPIDGWLPVTIPAQGSINRCINWVPPFGGQFCVQAELEMQNQPIQRSQRNIDIDEPLEPLVPHQRYFLVGNPTTEQVTVTIGLVPHLPDWGFELSQDVLANVEPGGMREVMLTVTPPEQLPPDGEPIVDVEAFIQGELLGGFRKIYRPPVPVHRSSDPIYAESEILIQPYPPRAGEPVEFAVELRNPTDQPQQTRVQFSVAPFGIGLPFTPIDVVTPTLPAESLTIPRIMWVPPLGGLWCFQVEISIVGTEYIVYSQRNIDVDEPLEPFITHNRSFLVGNPTNVPITISLGLVPHLADWSLELSQDVLANVEPGGFREVILSVTPPANLPQDGEPIVDVEAYVDGQLLGGFRKIYRPPVPVHRPADPIYAESEIGVDPYPILPGQPTRLSVELFNPTDQDQIITATFSVAHFGIGLQFTTTGIAPNPIPIFIPAHGAATGHVEWIPPEGWLGKFCVQVTLTILGHDPIWSQRNIDIGEPLEPGQDHRLEFPISSGDAQQPVTVTMGLVSHRPSWQIDIEPQQFMLLPNEVVMANLVVTPTLDGPLGTGQPIVDVEAYADGELLGGFRKLDVPPIPLHKPHEKGYAESEIQIEPYPPQLGQPTWVSTTLQNTSDSPMTVNLDFGWAQFGFGIDFSNEGMSPISRTVQLDPGMTETVGVSWTPVNSGHQCVRVLLSDPSGRYEPQESQRNVDVAEKVTCGQLIKTFTISNSTSLTVTVSIGTSAFNLPSGWTYVVDPTNIELGPYESAQVIVTITIPCPTNALAMSLLQTVHSLQEMVGGIPTLNVEGYANGELIGGVQFQFSGEVELPKIYLPILLK